MILYGGYRIERILYIIINIDNNLTLIYSLKCKEY